MPRLASTGSKGTQEKPGFEKEYDLRRVPGAELLPVQRFRCWETFQKSGDLILHVVVELGQALWGVQFDFLGGAASLVAR